MWHSYMNFHEHPGTLIETIIPVSFDFTEPKPEEIKTNKSSRGRFFALGNGGSLCNYKEIDTARQFARWIGQTTGQNCKIVELSEEEYDQLLKKKHEKCQVTYDKIYKPLPSQT